MGLLLGARDLGLRVEWRYGFVGYGQRAVTTPGVLYLDVGGIIQPGVLDHHGEATPGGCASELVLDNPQLVYNHLLAPWLARHGEGRTPEGTIWRPTVITHTGPDFDGVVAVTLARHLVEEGGFPPWAEALVAYTREVDQGRLTLRAANGADLYAPHLAYLVIQNLKDEVGRPWPYEAQLRRGLEMIERIVASLESARRASGLGTIRDLGDFLPGKSKVRGDWIDDPWFADIKSVLDGEPARFQRDSSSADCSKKVFLPALDGGSPIVTPAFVANAPTESVLNKYWVRAEGYPLFVCPYGKPRESDGSGRVVYPRVIVSVDPTWSDMGRRPSLQGLGFALEQAEVARRRELHDGIDDRGGLPRFGGGYCANNDPWYDGRTFEWTIVDAPRSGTSLPYDEVVRIATEAPFWRIPLSSGSLHLIWVDRGAQALRTDTPTRLEGFDGMAATLSELYQDSSVHCGTLPESVRAPSGFEVSVAVRRYPEGTCPPIRVVLLECKPGATLETLAELRASIVQSYGGTCPDYTFGRVCPGRHFAAPARVDRLVQRLADSELVPLDGIGDEGELVRFNGRSLLVRGGPSRATGTASSPDLEILLYVAFLNETLIEFSRRISALVPRDTASLHSLDTEPLRGDFLRFQASYYQIEVSRLARGRTMFDRLSTSLNLAAHYAEVQSELDRVAQLEQRLAEQRQAAAEERQAKADSVMQFVLYLVAVFGVLQTFLGYWSLESLRSFTLWMGTSSIALVAIALWFGVQRYKKRKC